MDPIVEPGVAPLRAAAGLLHDAGVLRAAPVAAIERRAGRLRARRRAGAVASVVLAAALAGGGVAARSEPDDPGVRAPGTDLAAGGDLTGSYGSLFARALVAGHRGSPQECPPPQRLLVFLDPRATAADREAVRGILADAPGVGGLRHQDQQQAYERFRELFADAPEMVEAVSPEVLPTSFLADVGDDRGLVAEVDARVRAVPGVREVIGPGRVCRFEPSSVVR